MLRRAEQRLDEVRGRGAIDDQEPGGAAADLPRGEIAEPDAGAKISDDVCDIEVQCERGPRAPPLPGLDFAGIELAGIEGIEPADAVRNAKPDADQYEYVDHAADPGISERPRRWRLGCGR